MCIIVFSLLINAVILLLNCLVSILHLCIHFVSLTCYFLYLKIVLKTVNRKPICRPKDSDPVTFRFLQTKTGFITYFIILP